MFSYNNIKDARVDRMTFLNGRGSNFWYIYFFTSAKKHIKHIKRIIKTFG